MGYGEDSRDFFAMFYGKGTVVAIICIVLVWIFLLMGE
jgi:hypothetical protein